MNISNFKTLATYDFTALDLSTLSYYQDEGDKILANMQQIDLSVINILDKINAEIEKRL